ncbi:MAG TPA: PilZ domain-containing protein [Terriglobales bacterium]|nr:PilZ domain-containing protein [Terriglobales bacterium]
MWDEISKRFDKKVRLAQRKVPESNDTQIAGSYGQNIRGVRAYPRYKVELRVLLTGRWSVIPEAFWINARDVGEGGMGADVPILLQEGEIVLLDLMLADQVLSLPAVVRYQTGPIHGFQFIAITEEQRITIRQYCQSKR